MADQEKGDTVSSFDYFEEEKLKLVLFCIVSHFLFLVNHPKKAVKEKKAVREGRKESLLEPTNLINCSSSFHIYSCLQRKLILEKKTRKCKR